MIRRIPRKLKKELVKAGKNLHEFLNEKNREICVRNSLDKIYENSYSSLTEAVQNEIKL